MRRPARLLGRSQLNNYSLGHWYHLETSTTDLTICDYLRCAHLAEMVHSSEQPTNACRLKPN